MKTIFLLAPSEWKNTWWKFGAEKLTYDLEKPTYIAINATEKDLKCKWDRFKEWIKLNKNLTKGSFCYSINRYSWVVFNAIWYDIMTKKQKDFFNDNVFILSWMYGILKPLDIIWNYKLPVETKWLYKFWWDKITNIIKEINPDCIVNLLPNSYAKMIDFKSIDSKLVNINFFKPDWKKMSHWVKKYRWEFLRKACEKQIVDYNDFWGDVVEDWNIVDINIIN